MLVFKQLPTRAQVPVESRWREEGEKSRQTERKAAKLPICGSFSRLLSSSFASCTASTEHAYCIWQMNIKGKGVFTNGTVSWPIQFTSFYMVSPASSSTESSTFFRTRKTIPFCQHRRCQCVPGRLGMEKNTFPHSSPRQNPDLRRGSRICHAVRVPNITQVNLRFQHASFSVPLKTVPAIRFKQHSVLINASESKR